jgi:hypothetical protein
VNDDTRFDAQVRGALAELPMPDDRQTREALVDVLRRSRAERSTPRWLVPTLVAAAVVAIVGLAGTFVQLRDPGDPQPAAPAGEVRGGWGRELAGAQQPGWDGRWLMTFDREGVFGLYGPASADASSDGASYALTKDTLRVDVFVNNACSELPAGVYTWSRAGNVLTLTLVEDPCAARAELLAGSWRSA